MAASSIHFHIFRFLFFFFFFLLSLAACIRLGKSASGVEVAGGGVRDELRKVVLGSRPPACVNKCLSCRPCEASLVIPPRRDAVGKPESNKRDRREDDSYYLLTWKCRCGTKLYQP